MKLTVNGEGREIAGAESLNVDEILAALKVSDPLYVTVELNGEILERAAFGSTLVKDGDALEFLYFMGGGAQ
ncbi:MAG: sulfur carrier protein ThiS [Kiritimatiellae bacterium]|nr:sulfur carrier protein ThiS [Kiritimatiellia bacterium]MCO5060553.1 sulfur carrier protein ThiS [Kiritimatiellia bacterium]MCO5068265.1 sulfur carrier protein ThiS [Kiritimatiellia bacterium]MCO6400866.1 sulfur carrier protein ThiS [Verrucomicrobiota bacterium]